MMAKRTTKTSLVVSILIAVFFTVGTEIIFSHGIKVQPNIDWSKLENMTYQDGQKYLTEHSTPLSGFDSFWMQTAYPEFWASLSNTFFAFVLSSLISCLVAFWWVEKKNMTVANDSV